MTLAWEGSDGRQVECEAPGFDELYEAHHRRVYRLALLLCGGEVALAEDVVSEAFTRVLPKWHGGQVQDFGAASLWYITAGPDGNVWFTDTEMSRIGRITPSGTLLPNYTVAGSIPIGIITGPDGNVWVTDPGEGGKIWRITPAGAATEYPIGGTTGNWPVAITVGHDGNLWFAEENSEEIGRITPTGTVTQFPVPSANASPYGITVGPDGHIWFTELGAGKIGRVDL